MSAGYTLYDGEVIAALHPASFHIQSREERESITTGDLVKLIFAPVDLRVMRERMWVKVELPPSEGCEGTGTLNSQPCDPASPLKRGDVVHFCAKHIVDSVFQRVVA